MQVAGARPLFRPRRSTADLFRDMEGTEVRLLSWAPRRCRITAVHGLGKTGARVRLPPSAPAALVQRRTLALYASDAGASPAGGSRTFASFVHPAGRHPHKVESSGQHRELAPWRVKRAGARRRLESGWCADDPRMGIKTSVLLQNHPAGAEFE